MAVAPKLGFEQGYCTSCNTVQKPGDDLQPMHRNVNCSKPTAGNCRTVVRILADWHSSNSPSHPSRLCLRLVSVVIHTSAMLHSIMGA